MYNKYYASYEVTRLLLCSRFLSIDRYAKHNYKLNKLPSFPTDVCSRGMAPKSSVDRAAGTHLPLSAAATAAAAAGALFTSAASSGFALSGDLSSKGG